MNEIAMLHPSFKNWAMMCLEQDELVSNFNRLNGTSLSFKVMPRTAIQQVVDKACGFDGMPINKPEEFSAFMEFVKDTFMRIPEVQKQFAKFQQSIESEHLTTQEQSWHQ